jgi:flagellar motor protein MotB
MARRRPAPKENHDRWLVSYADLVTLLFAFFVVMFASTQSDHVRAKEISQAVVKALNSGGEPPRLAAILGGTVDDSGHGDDRMKGPAVRRPTLRRRTRPLKTFQRRRLSCAASCAMKLPRVTSTFASKNGASLSV